MSFCEECGGIVVPKKEGGKTEFECRNCEIEYEKQEGEIISITEEKEEEDRGFIGEKDDETLPEIDEECGECGNGTAYWWTEQTRAADEPETRFFRCTECSHTWREYD
ncbi:MAG: transcription factor S [Candidatus Nanohaloarchaea archaeon]|nr:transcription factor S [Candidatus Nanohaloarchaea archaeon]